MAACGYDIVWLRGGWWCWLPCASRVQNQCAYRAPETNSYLVYFVPVDQFVKQLSYSKLVSLQTILNFNAATNPHLVYRFAYERSPVQFRVGNQSASVHLVLVKQSANSAFPVKPRISARPRGEIIGSQVKLPYYFTARCLKNNIRAPISRKHVLGPTNLPGTQPASRHVKPSVSITVSQPRVKCDCRRTRTVHEC